MQDNLTQELYSIFAVLPDGRSNEASREVLERYLRGSSSSAIVCWAEFDLSGQFIRGGATNMIDLSTRLFSDPGENCDIQALADGASTGLTRPGRIATPKDGTRCHWFVPFVPSGPAREPRIKGLSISEALLGELVALFNPTVSVTPAENRLLFQLLRGATPREAADEDGVSFETKRAQVKSVCSKLDCRGQSDLIRVMMGQLPHLLSIADTAILDDGAIERFTRDHLGPDVRLVLHRLPDGRLLRTFECGRADGTPLLVAHGMMYPLMLLNCREACEALGIRVIMPVRDGYLDNQPATALYAVQGAATDIADVALFVSQSLNTPIAVAGHSLGAAWAMDFAAEHPELVSRLVLLSPHFAGVTPSNSRFFGPFLRGLGSLANRPSLYRYVAWQFRRYFADARTVRRVLRRLFEASASDVRVLEGQTGSGPSYGWFASAYRSSIVGIAADMAAEMRSNPQNSLMPPVPVTIIRGLEDPVIGHGDAKQLARFTGPIDHKNLMQGGHLVAASHPEAMWALVAATILE